MVELVLRVIKRVVNLKFEPQIPNTNAKKISVKEIGNPIKITNNIAPSIIRPMVGFDRLRPSPIIPENQSASGRAFG
jgi:hypothetical protein